METINTRPNMVDITLDIGKKEQFRINGDDNRIIELDTSDLGVLNRLRETYPKLRELGFQGFEVEDDSDESIENMLDALSSINEQMAEIMDYIFDSKVARVCADGKPLYNMVAGKFIFEIILDTLFSLYSEHVNKEFNLMSARMKSHTSKYTGNK